MSHHLNHEPRLTPRNRATGDGDGAHTINRGSLQPCERCRRMDQAHLVLDPESMRTWTVFCEEHCPVCIERRAERLRQLLAEVGIQAAEEAAEVPEVVERPEAA